MMSYEEKTERLALIDAVHDARRLAALAATDQLDVLEPDGVQALRLISTKCVERIEDTVGIIEAQNVVLYAEERGSDPGSAED